MNRRTVIGRVAAGLGGVLVGGCSALGLAGRPAPARARRTVPVEVGWNRVIRTVVGLRPFRPGGFVLRAEKLDERVVIHDYGHGGGGITLSWGTAHMAVEDAMATGERRIAVIGCGAVGLATAILLQRRGAQVTIYAASLPPATTSNTAGAQWSPFSVFDGDAVTPLFRSQFERATRLAYREFQNLVGSRYGVRWVENYYISEQPVRLPPFVSALRDVYPDVEELPPDAHGFGTRYATRVTTMFVEPHIYLPNLIWDFRVMGGRIEVREFADVRELLTLRERVIMNCTGLGARALFGDTELIPVKGQLTVLVPQSDVDYLLLAGGLYMFPRSDGILLGGTFERGEWSLEPNQAEVRRIVEGHARLFASMRA